MLDVQSMVIYLVLALLCFFIAKYAELSNNRKAVWLIVILLSLVAGLRAVSVGIDTKTYNRVFSLISHGTIKGMYGIEESYIYICAVLLRIWDNNQFLFLIFASITHGLIIFRIWKDREFISFRWSVFSYYIMFFAFSLNGMRQFIATAIVIYATGVIKEGKYIKFILLILFASLFHTSALIGVAYLLFEILFTRYFDKKRKLRVFLLCGLVGVVGFAVASGLLNQYVGYFDQRSSSTGVMMFAKILLLILAIIVIEKPKYEEYKYTYYSYRWYYFIGLLLNSFSYFFLYTGRIGLYFYVFEAFYIGNIFKTKSKTIWIQLLKFGYVFLLLYYLYENLTSGAQGELPYRFFWQS